MSSHMIHGTRLILPDTIPREIRNGILHFIRMEKDPEAFEGVEELVAERCYTQTFIEFPTGSKYTMMQVADHHARMAMAMTGGISTVMADELEVSA